MDGAGPSRRRASPGALGELCELLMDQRGAVAALRNGGTTDDATLRRIERELDLEELRWSDPSEG